MKRLTIDKRKTCKVDPRLLRMIAAMLRALAKELDDLAGGGPVAAGSKR